MDSLGTMLFILLIIYSSLIILTVLLLNKFYRSSFVCGTKTKEIIKTRGFNYSSGDSGVTVTSYFSFETKDGKKINRVTTLFPMTKKGKKRYFFYNADRNEIVGKIYTVVWQSFFFVLNMLYSLIVGIPFFIISILIVIVTFWLYSKKYKKDYTKGTK